ncbi:lamin tail domain-containing protein, partial [bacterium]|nr:lamin tail domain-containing protein [bacterium]
LLLRKLLNNPEFKRNFILTGCDLLNTAFETQNVQSTLLAYRDWMQPSIADHFSRWGHNNMSHWDYQLNIMLNFAFHRPTYMRQDMHFYFDIGSVNQLTINVSPAGAGEVRVHSITPSAYPWDGQYFDDVPIDLEALPTPGYEFSHWAGHGSTDPDLTLELVLDSELTAVFVPSPDGPFDLVINEINFNSAAEFDAHDWVELYNASSIGAPLNGWTFSDANNDNIFVIDDIILDAFEYLIICNDTSSFRAIYGSEPRVLGDLDFNFSNGGELLRLFSYDGSLVDSVSYDDEAPWPTGADGDGPTLELTHPALDNGLSSSWAVSDMLGTPGLQNSRYAIPVGADGQNFPTDIYVGLAYPNPFNAQLSIPYSIPALEDVSVLIFDIRGALVFTETITPGPTGRSVYHWDGRNNSGQDCASGMYIIQMRQMQINVSLKVALLR